jgi:hypothetical protein
MDAERRYERNEYGMMPPDSWWRPPPCGHPEKPQVWIMPRGQMICHCCNILDFAPALPDGEHPDGEFVLCEMCGCIVLRFKFCDAEMEAEAAREEEALTKWGDQIFAAIRPLLPDVEKAIEVARAADRAVEGMGFFFVDEMGDDPVGSFTIPLGVVERDDPPVVVDEDGRVRTSFWVMDVLEVAMQRILDCAPTDGLAMQRIALDALRVIEK